MDEQFWVPHESAVFLPGRLLKDDGEFRTYTTDQGDVSVPAKETLEQIQSSDVLNGVNDICTLDSVTLAGLLHSIRVRYLRDDIYTNISRILIAVNPFKALSIYDDQNLGKYMSVKNPASLPPHIFGIGADLYHHFSQDGSSQAVLISGESGAGKSESTKLVLLYISQAFGGSDDSGVLQDEILEINPILEAFGNAKTVRNNNSSRFGKWIQVLVDPVSKKFKGAMVIDYLLEVTRVCSQGPGERNYHIFYQLMQDSTGELDDLQLEGGVEKFSYLNKNSADIANLNDNENFNMLCKAFAGLSFSQEAQADIFKIVAGILHLGNVNFTDSDDCKVEPGDALSTAAGLLCVDAEKLGQVMCKKRIVVGKETTWAPQTQVVASRARDAIAKLIYGRLFTWLVKKCNQTLGSLLSQTSSGSYPFIGVLDIAGFESFETNSLEQLFINLSNEKLQQFFTNYVFKSEVQEYEAEQLDIGQIEFSDNVDVLNLIEGKGGVLLMLDECTFGIRQTDELFTSNVVKAHQKDKNFIKPKFPTDPFFTIRHFAGDVKYTTNGFLEKNVAQKPPEVLELMASSSLEILKELAQEPESEKQQVSRRVSMGASAGKITVGSSFRKSLGQLVDKLGVAQMHFIRCIKPNPESLPGKLESSMVIDQLKLSGIMGAVQIRKIGYSFRQKHKDFIKRFLILLPTALKKKVLGDESLSTVDPLQASKSLLEVLGEVLTSSIAKSDYAMGKTKIFLRDSLHHALEMYRRSALVAPVLLIQAMWRGHHVRSKMRDVKVTYSEMQKLTTSIDFSNLSEVSSVATSVSEFGELLSLAEKLPLKLPKIQGFVQFGVKIDSDLNIATQIDDFVKAVSLDTLAMQAVLARAAANKIGGPLVESLQKHCSSVQEQLPLIHALKSSVDANLESMHILRNCLSQVEAKIADPEKWTIPEGPQLHKDAMAKLAELEQQQREIRRKKLQEAFLDKMMAAAEATEKEDMKIAFAEWIAEVRLVKKIKVAKAKVQTSMKEMNVTELTHVLAEAKNIGVPDEELSEAEQLFLSLQDSEFVNKEFMRVSELDCPDGLNDLVKSNLSAQYEALTGEMPGLKKRSGPSVSQKSEMDFSNLSSFSRLREPKADTWLNHLSWSSQRITETLTLVEPAFVKSGLQNFMNVMRCMGDKPAAYIGDKQQPVLDLAKHVPALRDEIYVQVLKQLTRNPSDESMKQGWELLRSLCSSAAPSQDLAEFVRAFLRAGLRKESMASMARERALSRSSRKSLPQARKSRKSFGDLVRDFTVAKSAIAGEALEFFNDTMLEVEKTVEANDALAGQETQNVEVHLADGSFRNVKVKKGLTLEWLRCHMLDNLGIERGNDFELFESDPADNRSHWHLLARAKNVVAAMLEAQEAGHRIYFGRINLLSSELLEVDDVANARLTYDHAVKQFMSCKRLPAAVEADKLLYVKVATALVSCDKATYEKKQKGGPDSFNAKVDQLQAEFEAGLSGVGVLERYLPKPWFELFDRSALAKAVHDGLTELGAFSDNIRGFELMWKSRALSLIQSSCPLLETYTFGPASFVPKSDIANEQLEWVGMTSVAPQQVLEMNASEKFLLSISRKHIEVIPDDGGETISIPIQLGLESRYLNCWAVIPGDRIAFSFIDFSLPVGLILKVPDGVSEAVAVFLARFQSC